jgi:two-component system chemotaxis response regulator CheB
MGTALKTIMKQAARPNSNDIPADIKAEASLDERAITRISDMNDLGRQSLYTCPDCGGALWEIDADGISRYRCFTGHAFSENDLMQKQTESIEDTLWTALRSMEERKSLALKLEARYRTKGITDMAARNRDVAKEMDVHIARLRAILISNEPGNA